MKLLALLFLFTATIYSSVGFGGGSTYTALLVLFAVDYRLIPIVSLCCNIIVVSAGAVYFIKNRLVDNKLLLALISFSIPMSFIGGSLTIAEQDFVLILACALLLSSIFLFMHKANQETVTTRASHPYWLIGAVIGLPVGFIAGITGIGGGIFLAPILHIFRIAHAKTIAATACLFILVNSIAGLIGQLNKSLSFVMQSSEELSTFLVLPIAVLIGGLIGNRAAINYLSPVQLRRMTAMVILIVAIRLLIKSYSY